MLDRRETGVHDSPTYAYTNVDWDWLRAWGAGWVLSARKYSRGRPHVISSLGVIALGPLSMEIGGATFGPKCSASIPGHLAPTIPSAFIRISLFHPFSRYSNTPLALSLFLPYLPFSVSRSIGLMIGLTVVGPTFGRLLDLNINSNVQTLVIHVLNHGIMLAW